LAIIYFSGHGGSQRGGSDEDDGCDEYICCFDEGLLDDVIWNAVCKAKGRVFLIFDCCHSETMFRSPGIKFNVARRRGLKAGFVPDMLCWSGCPDDSYSYGSANGGEFTKALRKYVKSGETYAEVWKKISKDSSLAAQQEVRSTEIGDFGAKREKIFR